MNSIFIIIIIISWLSVISFFLFRAISNYNKLTKGVAQKTLSQILTDFLKENTQTQKTMQSMLNELELFKKNSLFSIQRIGLVRFNPFSDTGGDQSFVLALLDGNNSGIILTSLYARTGVRWYVKTIKNGKGVEHELTKEENEAIKNVKHVKN